MTAKRNPYEVAGRLVPLMLRSLSKFGSDLTSKNVGTVLRGLDAEVWRGTAVRSGINPPSAETIEAVIFAIEVVYEDTEERVTLLDIDCATDVDLRVPSDDARDTEPSSGVVWH
jgi:hypothetical protein